MSRFWKESPNIWEPLESGDKIFGRIRSGSGSGVAREEGASVDRQSWAQDPGSHQHYLQSFKSVFLSKNLSQNMPKSAFKNNCKNRRSWKFPHPTPLWHPAARISAHRPPCCTPSYCYSFLNAKFSH